VESIVGFGHRVDVEATSPRHDRVFAEPIGPVAAHRTPSMKRRSPRSAGRSDAGASVPWGSVMQCY
jgi:hypothetical protein